MHNIYENILESFSDGVIVLDAEKNILYLNQTGERLTGYSRDSAKSKPVYEFIPYIKKLSAPIENAMSKNEAFRTIDESFTSRSFRKVPAEINIMPFINENGKTVGAVLTIKDISFYKYFEDEEIKKGRADTTEIMALSLAHEIRNPLSGIKGAAQLMSKEGLNASSPYLNLIVKESERINSLIEHLLKLSSPEKLKMSWFNIHQLLDEVILLNLSSPEKEVLVVKEFDPSIPEIHGDYDKLKQVFINVVKNSVEAISDGGKIIFRSKYVLDYHIKPRKDKYRGGIIVEISDNGKGINAREIKKLFTPFFTTKSKGSGLGLFLCRKIILEHDGNIRVESKKGKGTAVIIYLQLKRKTV